METANPKKLGKYDIVGTLGKGAMGIVYDAFDPIIERRVAIKTISKDAMDVSEADELLGRFKREASAAGRLNHPGVVSIYDYGEEGNVAFIAMEYIKGKELKHYFDAGERFETKHYVRIMCEILDALDHAHRNRVYHRDIKPANIMITEEGRVKVADFGVARIESSMMTQVGTRIGTPAYMSPEQHQALPVDGRSDVFSCGVILYQFLTGERPFTGGGYTIVQQILKQDPIPPSEINFTLPRAFDFIVAKALAKKPSDRYKTAKDFIDALKRAAGEDQTGGAVDVDFEFEDSPEQAEAKPARPEVPPKGSPAGGATGATGGTGGTGNAEVALEQEFWNEIKDSTHKLDFEQFLESFPLGRLAPVARMRLRKLEAQQPVERTVIRPEAPADGTVVRTGPSKITIRPMAPVQRAPGTDTAAEEARKSEEAQKRKQAEAERDAAEQARLKQEQEQREAEEQKRLAEESARRAATEQEKREAEARRRQEAADKAKREAEERKRQEAEARAKREAEDKARKEAEEEQQRQAREKARLEAEAKAAKEAEEKARREAEAKTKREAEEQRQRELEERERKAAEAKDQREAETRRLKEEEKARQLTERQERERKESEALRLKEEEKARQQAEREERERKEVEARARHEGDDDQTRSVPAESKPGRGKGKAGAKAKQEADTTPIDFDLTDGAHSQAALQTPAALVSHVPAVDAKTTPPTPPAAKAQPDFNETVAFAAGKHSLAAQPAARQDVAPVRVIAPAPAIAPAPVVASARTVTPATVAKQVPDNAPATPVARTPVPEPVAAPLPNSISLPPAAPPTSSVYSIADRDEPAVVAPPAKKSSSMSMAIGAVVLVAAAGASWMMMSKPTTPVETPQSAKLKEMEKETERLKAIEDAAKSVPAPVVKAPAPEKPKAEAPAAEPEKAPEPVKDSRKLEAEKKALDDKTRKETAEKAKAEADAKKSKGETEVAKAKTDSDAKARNEAATKADAEAKAREATARAEAEAKARAEATAKAEADAARVRTEAVAKAEADTARVRTEAVAKAEAAKVAATKADAERAEAAKAPVVVVAAAAPTVSSADLYTRAIGLRKAGNVREATRLLRQAASAGHGPSSKALSEILSSGEGDQRADQTEASKYGNLAKQQGEAVDRSGLSRQVGR